MLHIIQNDPRVPAGIFGEILREQRVVWRTFRPYAGEGFPAPDAAATIVLGGYMGVSDTAEYPFLLPLRAFMRGAVEAGTPLLGICLGGQLLAASLGAEVRGDSRGERGLHGLALTAAGVADPLFKGVSAPFAAFQWHSDSFDIPAGAEHLAASSLCPGQAFRFGPCAYGLQFHPEVDAAIVADWCRRAGVGNEVVESFRRREGECVRIGRRLLTNFLRMAGE